MSPLVSLTRLIPPRIPRVCSRACRLYPALVVPRRLASGNTAQEIENTNVGHSRFIAEAEATTKWKDAGKKDSSGVTAAEDFDTIKEGKGKLSPTSSHLFKLILPLNKLAARRKDPPPIVILLHPSQPLSHAARLILSALPAKMRQNPPEISFRSITATGQLFQWSNSTDVGDFIRDASQSAHFSISLAPPEKADETQREDSDSDEESDSSSTSSKGDGVKHPLKRSIPGETVIEVTVPTFADRTRFLRRKLDIVTRRLKRMDALKAECDREAHRGARRMAVGGLGMLIVYWGAVARLTFWDYGWDIMEPVTYLSGLSTVILGYLWFLYQGRDVSYSSILNRSVSARREALYHTKGLDIDRWLDLITEAKSLKKEINRIAEDYDDDARSKHKEEDEEEDKKDEREKTRKTETANGSLPEMDEMDEKRRNQKGKGGDKR